ncbi:hypothetical protein [Paenibacillus koleovorans]|uniref:hypothetical protein n=1 Tax=Paenibacillus koleovorans TaxID=121608 RepID=UPI000FD7422F|nr:hypothetical protein [Paenibacillus koleovorans]
MNLADMLCYADIQQLSSIANTYDCECNGHSKNELIQSILTKVNRRDVFEEQVTKLTIEDIRFLNSIVFEKRDTFSLEELTARASQSRFPQPNQLNQPNQQTQQPAHPAEQLQKAKAKATAKAKASAKAKATPLQTEQRSAIGTNGSIGASNTNGEAESRSPREMISQFKHRGWLFNGFSQQTRYLFQFPQDMKRRFQETLLKQFQTNLEYLDEPAVYRDEQRLIVDDIYALLHYVYHQDIQLTADGTMYKRFIQQILDRMSVGEELPKEMWRFGYGRQFKELPNRLSLLYDYCYFHNMLTEQEGALLLTDKGKQTVLEGRREDLTQVYRLWFKLYKNPIPGLQAIVYWVDKLAQDWIETAALERTLCPLIRPFYYDTPESILHKRVLQMMMHLGLLRIGEDESRGTVVKMTKLGSGVVTGTYVAEEDRITIAIDNLNFPC